MKRRTERIALVILLGGASVFAFMLWYGVGYGTSARWSSGYRRADGKGVGLQLILGGSRGRLEVQVYDFKSKLSTAPPSPIFVRVKSSKGQVEIYEVNKGHTQTGPLLARALIDSYAQLKVRFVQPNKHQLPASLVFQRVMPSS